jgi:hypothetical protein
LLNPLIRSGACLHFDARFLFERLDYGKGVFFFEAKRNGRCAGRATLPTPTTPTFMASLFIGIVALGGANAATNRMAVGDKSLPTRF